MASGDPVKVAVIGAGSIGSRHARILNELGHQVIVVSSHAQFGNHQRIRDALKQDQYEYVVVASKTSQHNSDLKELLSAGFAGKVLVEKPLFASTEKIQTNEFNLAAVGYNLRFHPAIRWLRTTLPQLGAISSANFYVGQYLPTWRESRDYRTSSSASIDSGGGVLRDLSHELDLAQLFFGNWHQLTAVGGKFSNLEIESQDTFSILLQTEKSPVVSIQLNYLDRLSQRTVTINGDNGTISLDLISGVARFNYVTETFRVESDQTYTAQHNAMIAGESNELCSFEQALAVLQTIEAIEIASAKHVWVKK